MLHRLRHRQVTHLRIGEHLVHLVDRPAWHPGLVERFDPRGSGPGRQPLGKHRVEFGAVPRSLGRRVEPRVGGQPRQAGDLAQALQQSPVSAADVDVAVGGGKAPHRHAHRVVVPGGRWHVLVDRPARGLKVHHRDHRFKQRGLDPPSGPGPLPVVQRDQHADRQVQAGGQVRHRDPGPGRLAARQPGYAHQAAHPLRNLIQAAPGRVRAVLAEAGDRAVDQTRVPFVHGFEVEPQPVLDRRAHVLDQYVAHVDQAHQDLVRRRGLEVQ